MPVGASCGTASRCSASSDWSSSSEPVSALLGQGSQWRVSVILALFFWTGIARVVRGIFLSLREKEYVEAAKASGANDMRIMFRHILPNTLGPIIVNGTIAVAAAIIT